MGYYPLFLQLERMRVLLVGAGSVGRRKATDLLGGKRAESAAGFAQVEPMQGNSVQTDGVQAKLAQGSCAVGNAACASDPAAGLPESFLWLDPGVTLAELAVLPEFSGLGKKLADCAESLVAGAEPPAMEPLIAPPRLVFEQRAFRPEDLQGRDLVFAATGSRDCNAEIAKLCAERRILCNVIDAPEEGSFIVPAHFEQDSITLAFSTGGKSPALARRLRMDIQAWLGGKYGPLLALLARLRPLVLAAEPENAHSNCELFRSVEQVGSSSSNCELFRSLVNSELADALYRRDMQQAGQILRTLLPASLHGHIDDLLHELY